MDSELMDVDFLEANWDTDIDDLTFCQICETLEKKLVKSEIHFRTPVTKEELKNIVSNREKSNTKSNTKWSSMY